METKKALIIILKEAEERIEHFRFDWADDPEQQERIKEYGQALEVATKYINSL